MKAKRVLCALLAALVVSAGVPVTALAAETDGEAAQTEIKQTGQTDDGEEANLGGNLVNGGMATTYDGVVYYANSNDGGCLYGERDGQQEKLTDFAVQYLNVSKEGALYYTVVDGAEGLTKIGRYDIAAGTQTTIFAIDVHKGIKNLIVRDGVCYFISDGVVYALTIATGQQETLLNGLSDVTAFLFFDGGYAYSRLTDGGETPVVVYQYDTMTETTVTKSAAGFDVSGDFVYYANSDDDYRLYRAALDGSGREPLSDGAVCNIVAVEDKVYYKDRATQSEVLVYDVEKGAETEEGAGSCTEFTVLPEEEVVTATNDVVDMTEIEALETAASSRVGTMASSAYKTWKQYDSRWGNLPVGTGGTMRQIGCLVTSLAICIVDAEIRSEDEFDPGVFVTLLNNNGGFESGGNLRWFAVSSLIPEFQVNQWRQSLTSMTQAQKVETIQSHLDAGRQVVVNVNNGGHWVAVDSVSGDNVTICDPGYNKTHLFQTSSNDSAGYALSSVVLLATYDVNGSGGSSESLVKYEVTGNDVRYRDKPSTSGGVKGTLNKGDTVQVVAGDSTTADGYTWYKIKRSGSYYYVASDYLKKVQIAPTGVTLSESSVTVAVGGSFSLVASVSPSGSDSTVTWSSSNKAVATVSSAGVVKGVKAGSATITAKTVNGKTATCKVTVTDKETLVDYVVVVDDSLNYRASPNGVIKGSLKNGTKVQVVEGASETVNGLLWYQIKLNGGYYYVASSYLQKASNNTSVTLNKVTGLKAIKKTETTLTLQFNKVDGATGYQIYDAESNKLLTTCSTQNGVSVLTKTVTGLNPGETRKYKVRAYAKSGSTTSYGAFSAVYEKATAAPALAQVTGLKAIKKTETTLKLQFNKVAKATGYEIYDAESNKLLTTVSTQNGVSVLTKTITGLNPGETRKYKVRAYAKSGSTTSYGAFSAVYEKATAAPALAQVTGLKAIKKTETTLKLQFNKVAKATGYEIYDAETNKLLTTVSTQNGVSVLTKTVTGLNPGETRKYKVRAYAKSGGTTSYGAFSAVYQKATAEKLVQYVTIDKVNCRTAPSTSATVYRELAKGTKVNVVSGYSKKANDMTWFKIKRDGKYYYMASKYLKKA